MVRRAGILTAVRVLLLTLLVALAAGCGGGGDGDEKPDAVAGSSIAVYHFERDLRGPTSIGEIVCLPAAGSCPNGQPGEQEQYLVLAGARLDGNDVDRDATRADRDPATGMPVVLLALNDEGAKKFRALTRQLAKSGRTAGAPHHLAIVVNGEMVGWPGFDYRAFPDGLEDASAIQIPFADDAAAQRLVKRVRG
jgi:hypothetical protein